MRRAGWDGRGETVRRAKRPPPPLGGPRVGSPQGAATLSPVGIAGGGHAASSGGLVGVCSGSALVAGA